MLNDETLTGTNYTERRVSSKPRNRVDINLLMSKVREDKKKEKKESIIFYGLLGSALVVTGIIASL